MALTSIASSLGAGSGIDIPKLVDDLAAASREPKVTRLSTLAQQNQARISAVSQARSNLEGFADSLAQMVSDGTLRSTPTVSDESVISATTRAGINADSFSATVVVDQLARAQTAYSAVVADKTAAIGTGTMTLSVGGTDHVITIDSTKNSLEGLAKAINASGSGVSASIVSDTGGSRIVLKGATGAANSFTLTADAGADPALAAFGYGAGGGMTLGQSATDAQFTIDGVAYSRSSNIVDDVIPGMSLTLKKASPGQEVDVGASRPLDMIRQTVKDFVDVYNQLKKSITDAAAMSGDTRGLRELEGQLRGMMSQTLTSSGTYTTLADIGIYTNKDGLLAVDQTRLETALTTDAGAVEALFNPPRDGAHTDVRILPTSSTRSTSAKMPIARGWRKNTARSTPSWQPSRRPRPIWNSRSRCGTTRTAITKGFRRACHRLDRPRHRHLPPAAAGKPRRGRRPGRARRHAL